MAVESLTEVQLDGLGLGVLTFEAEENTAYLAYAVGATATLGEHGDLEAGVEEGAYSLPDDEARIVVHGEPGAEVLVSLQLLGGEDVPLGGATSEELVVGDCANHWLYTGGVDELAVVLGGDLERLTHGQGYLYDDDPGLPQRTDADGHEVVSTKGTDGFSYRVCNTSDATATYELRTEEHLEPGETPTPRPSVDGQPSVTGTLAPGQVAVHRVFVPAGYVASVSVTPDDATDIEFRTYSTGGGYGHLTSHGRGDAEFVDEYGDEPDGSTALLLVRHDPDAPTPPQGRYTIRVE
ncbi:hypothetical protein [Blastococcus sp. SYSU D00695]